MLFTVHRVVASTIRGNDFIKIGFLLPDGSENSCIISKNETFSFLIRLRIVLLDIR